MAGAECSEGCETVRSDTTIPSIFSSPGFVVPAKVGCSRHVENEATYLGGDGRSAPTGCLGLGEAAPEPPEALALPPHDSVRLHDKQSGSPPTPDFGQRTPEEMVAGGQFRSGTRALIRHKLKS